MSNKIESLLQDAQLRQQLETVTNVVEATQLIVTTAAKKGYAFTQASVEAAIAQFRNPVELSEDALEAVAGGYFPPTYTNSVYLCGGSNAI